MLNATLISERRACALVGLSRDSWRHPPQRAQDDQATSQRIVELAHERRRFGYRRIGDLLRAAGTKINDKRVYRLYKLADLSVRKRRGKQRLKLERVPLHECQTVNEVWSMDFVSDSLASGRRIKCLTVTDDFSHECVDIAVDHGIGGEYVVRVLDQVARFRGYPQAVRTDQGPEFTSRAFMTWAQAKGVRHILNQPGKPTSISARLTHSFSVCGTQPILGAMDSMAAHSDGYSPRCSCTILTARSRTSGENLFDLLMAQSSQSVEPPRNPGRFNEPVVPSSLIAAWRPIVSQCVSGEC
ncbi:transposase InsO family protein [Pelomonas aquatica]|uniref:Transposase InsO family protein n=1 Tax=Pelomonas aquatica TaxID=431058 RepID=A0ABU1Z6P1_9BURK|nr:transposase InsO family protein [Pelomonas aquatica]